MKKNADIKNDTKRSTWKKKKKLLCCSDKNITRFIYTLTYMIINQIIYSRWIPN